MKYLLSPFFLAIFVFNSIGQSYPDDKEKFMKIFEKNVREYAAEDTKDFLKKELSVMLLETNEFPESYFKTMVSTCNKIEAKKLKAYPDIYNYVFSVASFIKGKQSNQSFKAWQNSIDKLLESRYVKRFTEFIELSASFFSERKISTSANYDWYYRGGKYEFVYSDKAYINFEEGALVCLVSSSKRKTYGEGVDSIAVFKTQGKYDPILKKWKGRGGKVTWEKVGLDTETTFAELKGYEISMKTSDLRVDTALLTSAYFDKPIAGFLSDRAFKINRESDRVYPQFLSFKKKLLIKNIVENVDYIGGFSLKGGDFVGAGTTKDLAQVTIMKDGAPFITAKSTEIYVNKIKIQSRRTRIRTNFRTGDSLSHPGVDFTYDLEAKLISMTRNNSGSGQSPFTDSYHQLDIYVPKVEWKVGTDQLNFTYDLSTSLDQRSARFESRDYFNARLYDQLQGNARNHPLASIYAYAYKYDEFIMEEGKAASALGMTIQTAKPTLLDLAAMGFLSYDTEAGIVTVNNKMVNFVQAKSGTKDYDNIVFNSDFRPKELKGYSKEQIEQSEYLQKVQKIYTEQNEQRRLMKDFGVMDLSTMDLDLVAVDAVAISESNNVVAFPDNSEVKVRENRNFNSSGWINSGKLEINTLASNFIYDDFKFKILKSTEALFRVRPLRREDGNKSIATISRLEGVSGELMVDDPNNRSGLKEGFDDFPKLNCTSNSKVFYNSDDVFRGVYDSTRFYYTVFPFEMDSLDGFYERTFRLEGELISAGIFPIINEPLRLMPDYSFGFSITAPEEGYDFYGTEAKYEDKVILSHNGLQGAGTINFVHSTSVSKGFNFLPDSTIGVAEFINRPIESGIEFPDVYADEAFISYIPKQNRMKASSLPKKQIRFFGKEAKLKGTAIVTPKGMRGKGVMTFKNATMISDNYSFTNLDINADTSSFSLRNESQDLSEDAMAFKTDNCKGNVSFKERKGIFTSNDGETSVEFPVNQYKCRMDKFTWFMDSYDIAMERAKQENLDINAGVDLLGPNFFSTHPKQDSLQFMAPKANFDLKKKLITCKEVEYINVADAIIYPDSSILRIRKKARMDVLKNAKIEANYITKYHTFLDAEVEIKARRDYEATGLYPYYDRDSNKFMITMTSIDLDTSFNTKGVGLIKDSEGFKLSDEFDYYGNISVSARTPEILFSGATRINHNCEKFDRNWMAFNAKLDPKKIQIPVSSEMNDLEGNPISAGIVWRNSEFNNEIRMYPTFLSGLADPSDPIVITASGFLQYNADSKEFQIGSQDKLVNRGEKGNYIALNTKTCSMEGDGIISLGMDFGVPNVETVGTVSYNQEKDETSLNLTAKFDLGLDKGLMQSLGKRINGIEGIKGPRDLRGITVEQAITEWEDVKAADKFKTDYVYGGRVKALPDALNNSIVLTGIKMKSYAKPGSEKGLITTNGTATIVNFYGEPLMKEMPMKLFFEQVYNPPKTDKKEQKEGDSFILNFSAPGGSDYYFYYDHDLKEPLLELISTDIDFLADIDAIKEDKRKKKGYLYKSGTGTTPEIILRRLFE